MPYPVSTSPRCIDVKCFRIQVDKEVFERRGAEKGDSTGTFYFVSCFQGQPRGQQEDSRPSRLAVEGCDWRVQ